MIVQYPDLHLALFTRESKTTPFTPYGRLSLLCPAYRCPILMDILSSLLDLSLFYTIKILESDLTSFYFTLDHQRFDWEDREVP